MTAELPPNIPLPESAPVAPVTLGLDVVNTDNQQVNELINIDRASPEQTPENLATEQEVHELGWAALKSLFKRNIEQTKIHEAVPTQEDTKPERSLTEQLQDVRDRLTALNPREQAILSTYIKQKMSPFLKSLKEEDGPQSWADWLGKNASDTQLKNFLQWHVDEVSKQQTPELRASADEMKHELQAAVVAGVDEGWLSKDCLEWSKTVSDAEVYIGDVFDMLMQSTDGRYYRGSKPFITIGQTYDGEGKIVNMSPDELKSTLRHELIHDMLFESSLTQAPWVHEAVTEHINQVIAHGEPDILWPSERSNTDDDDLVYAANRQLLSRLVGPVDGDTRRVIQALTSNDILEQNKMWRAVDKRWGVANVQHVVSREVYRRTYEPSLEEADATRSEREKAALFSVQRDLRVDPEQFFANATKDQDYQAVAA